MRGSDRIDCLHANLLREYQGCVLRHNAESNPDLIFVICPFWMIMSCHVAVKLWPALTQHFAELIEIQC
jgi:hypothetical protein